MNFKKIANIKKKKDLLKYHLDEPLIGKNYLFHYLIIFDNLPALKLYNFSVFKENNYGLNAFHLAASENKLNILDYLIKTYPDYIYNRSLDDKTFGFYLKNELVSSFITKYPDLDWNELIINGSNSLGEKLIHITINLNYQELLKFIKVFNIPPDQNNNYLFTIIRNQNLNTNEKIKILDNFSDEELNVKTITNNGIILESIFINDFNIFKYLLSRNIDIDYQHITSTVSPLQEAIYTDIINNKKLFTTEIIKKLKTKPEFYKQYSLKLNNIGHIVLYTRLNTQNLMKPETKIDYSIDLDVLNFLDDDIWNQPNIFKVTPLELIKYFDYDIYSTVLINNKIKINPDIINKILNKDTPIDQRWITLFKKLPVYKIKQDSIKMIESYEYSHYSFFSPMIISIPIVFLYYIEKYPELLIPTMDNYQLKKEALEINTKNNIFTVVMNEENFPWNIVYYLDNNNYYIHPYLNSIINSEKNSNKRFACINIHLTSLDSINGHANLLIYDFKNMIIERFDPNGNESSSNQIIDDILEEELTWNTGFKYRRPNDYLPYACFQHLAEEWERQNKKHGDISGFCLAWCFWYLETKLKNPDVDSKILVEKLIFKLNNLDIKYSEYIRNYANNLEKKKYELLILNGFDPKEVSNIFPSNKYFNKYLDFIYDKYNKKIN